MLQYSDWIANSSYRIRSAFFTTGLVLFLLFPAWVKEDAYRDEGRITGADLTLCGCCGDWFIEINNNTYRFYTLPNNSGLDLNNETIPVPVELDWQPVEQAFLGGEIIGSDTPKKIKKYILPPFRKVPR